MVQLAFIYIHKIKDLSEGGHIFLCQLSRSNLWASTDSVSGVAAARAASTALSICCRTFRILFSTNMLLKCVRKARSKVNQCVGFR